MGFFKRLFGWGRPAPADEEPAGGIAELTRAIRRDPGDFLAYANRGDAFRNAGDLDRAIEDYSAAIECYRGRLAYLRSGQVGGAVPLRDALRTSPEVALACFHRGCVYSSRGEYDRAIADFTELIQVSPKGEYFSERASAYRATGAIEKAIGDEQMARELVVERPER